MVIVVIRIGSTSRHVRWRMINVNLFFLQLKRNCASKACGNSSVCYFSLGLVSFWVKFSSFRKMSWNFCMLSKIIRVRK